MKKKLLLVTVLAFTLYGCGANNSGSTTVVNYSTNQETESSNAAATEETETSETTENTISEEVFSFTYNGCKISINADMAPVLEAIGEPNSIFVETTCAFDGCENDYIYGSFEIAENEMTETSYIASIYLLDDLVATEEGLRISMTKDEALEIYGTPDSESDTSIVYLKGDSSLTIIFESAESSTISSIVYESTKVVE